MKKNPLSFFFLDLRRRLPYQRYLDTSDRPRRLRALAWSLLTLISGIAYLAWLAWLTAAQGTALDFFFLTAEALSFLLLGLLAYDTWHLRGHRPEGLPLAHKPTVDILVPCCGEPLEVIGATLRAVNNITYEPRQVYVLDDGGDSAVAALAQSLRFSYLSRLAAGQPRKDSKSGNLNFGLSYSRGELLLVLDSDQVAAPDILDKLVGFFALPRVAYVQSKQSFFLPDDDPFYNADQVFYETLQLSNDQANAVISCGSGVVYRRSALEEMGGFATWNLVEDFTTSYELLSRGWKGIYFPYALSRGLAPTTLGGLYRQRFQWCLDTMRLFFWDNPLFKTGLNWTQRLHFLTVMGSYLASGLVFPILYILPLFVYWRGPIGYLGDDAPYLLLRSAYLVATILMFRYLFYRKGALKQFKMLCSLFPVHALAIFFALFYPPGRKPAYRVNNLKPLANNQSLTQLVPHLGLISLHLAMPFVALWQGWASPRLVFCNAFFSTFIIWVLGDLVLAVLARREWSPALDPRRVYGESCQ
jgi:cellulose synthase (UDP-forming)